MEFLLLLIVPPGVLVGSFVSFIFCELAGLEVDGVRLEMGRRRGDPGDLLQTAGLL